MQIKAQEFLPIAEKAGALAFLDIEATGLKADYNGIIVVSIKPYGQKPISFSCAPGQDDTILKAVRDTLHEFPLWVTFYGKGFDIPMIRSRLVVFGMNPLEDHHHIDMYYVVRDRFLTARRSQAHLLEWLGTKQKKMTLSPSAWVDVLKDPKKNLPIMVKRCESDVAGLEALYNRTKQHIREITR